MQFRTLLVSFFVAAAVAQTRTSGSAAPSDTSSSSANLVSSVEDLPKCALNCLKSAASSINCDPANFKCLCSNTQDLIASIGPCALSACNTGDVSKLTEVATKVCQEIKSNPPAAEIASASSIVAAAIATANSTSSSGGASSTSAQGAAAKRTDTPVYAVMGGAAAAWAAYAM
ncbi:uncharacterized protein PgNI_03610 [Pyricularia grisea]|uniref:CFEM domain-containing protein n=1 Tax=Pyricularia grisea TaxID=148305 RepID=A0A6P8B872_PYRGI|nr:uncharacterized protein PgNI_03610 [Pyricularia grisea]TLD11976.1 hypothetical protein PgNI_03610 [Pyricularia grisea]